MHRRLLCTFWPSIRALSTKVGWANRAIVYAQNGDPSKVLNVVEYPPLPPPLPYTVNIKYLLSPINPADVNVVEGVYPTRPISTDSLTPIGRGSKDDPVFVGGNEGLAEVTDIGDGIRGLKEGDWVIMVKQQAGTWSSARNVQMNDILKLPSAKSLTEVQAATITVNPSTAYNMLHDFIKLETGDWIVQNGANSAVGQAVIQIAASKGVKTLNFVRSRDTLEQLRAHLINLGATHVLTYDDLTRKAFREEIKSLTSGKEIQLCLNCVGGQETQLMVRLLGSDCHLVSYGAMSKQPLALPTSLFIFKNLKAHGFWQSRWYKERPRTEQEELMRKLTQLMLEGKLDAPDHEIITIPTTDSCEEASSRVRSIFKKLEKGRHGKKILLKLETGSRLL
ncbi:hypothetical protein AMATHDRAFT_77469 [Amanita thiersii Skay4041]|uniref:enoyl-[acyl-carrier-protein] reductase n=1 Tax=Amanita thiersii Skay4041 TaxID=703135 RepID=A0A2A9NGV9_9AGAR|nr:hypothetical protein AMATHDRAFT_77469 [Amanita thiersii Skay4041]